MKGILSLVQAVAVAGLLIGDLAAETSVRPLPGEDGAKAALLPEPFPDRMSAYVWRNWGLVEKARLADVVGFHRKAISEVRGGMRAFLSVVGLFLLFFVHYSKGFLRPAGLDYQGFSLILMAFGTVMFFYYLPLEKSPAWLGRVIELASRYCMGIYCCHLLVGWILYAWVLPWFGVKFEGFVSNIWIWVVSWMVCWLIARIPGRFAKDLML